MTTLNFSPHLFPLIAFVVGGGLLALVSVLGARKSAAGYTASATGVVFCIGLICGGVAALSRGLAAGYWLPLFVLAGIYVAVIALPSEGSRVVLGYLRGLLTTPRNRGIAVLTLCGAGITISLHVAMTYLEPPPPYELPPELAHADALSHLVDVEGRCAYTDAGRPIGLRTSAAPNAGHLDPNTLRSQNELLTRHGLRDQVIHVPVGWQNCNCHGWVFTAGQYWLSGEHVDMILQDNQYHPVFSPRSGDLAVYRSVDNGTVTHTGVVRYVSPDGGTILVESKWGGMGRFIHPHDIHSYGTDECTFHRSPRSGHRLHGLSSTPQPRSSVTEGMDYYVPTPSDSSQAF